MTYENIINVCDKLNITINKDSIFDEISTFNKCMNDLKVSHNFSEKCIDNYCKILSTINLPNITTVAESVFAIPVANDYVERVFSNLTKVWTDERNRMSIGLIKAEICVKNNFSFTCIEFKDVIKNEKCIKSVKSYKKYRFVNI